MRSFSVDVALPFVVFLLRNGTMPGTRSGGGAKPRKKKPVRRTLRRSLLALIALLVLWFFQGLLPVGGSDEGSSERSAERRVPSRVELAPVAPPELELRPELLEPDEPELEQESAEADPQQDDVLASLRAKCEWLLVEGQLGALRAFAERLLEQEESAPAQEIAQSALRRLDDRGAELEEQLRQAFESEDLALAEERLIALHANWPERARAFVDQLPQAPAQGPQPAAILADELPIEMAPGRSLFRIRDELAMLRERGDQGFRFRRLPLHELSPFELRSALQSSAMAEAARGAALESFARVYARAGRPLAAATLLREPVAQPKPARR
jgi:hypothetical protein